jgi:hypothetical protein
MTIDDLKDILTIKPDKRDFILYTGIAGHDMLRDAIRRHHDAIRRHIVLQNLIYLLNMECIDLHKKESLEKMINSPDIDDFNLALELMIQFQKSNQNGDNI